MTSNVTWFPYATTFFNVIIVMAAYFSARASSNSAKIAADLLKFEHEKYERERVEVRQKMLFTLKELFRDSASNPQKLESFNYLRKLANLSTAEENDILNVQ